MTGANPLDWFGTEFLIFYGLGFVVCLLAGSLIEAWLRPTGTPGYVDNPNELALLSGNANRLAETAVASMLDAELIGFRAKKYFVRRTGAPRDNFERRILDIGEHIKWPQVTRVVKQEAAAMRERLVRRELLVSSGSAFTTGIAAALPLFALFVLGIGKYLVGEARDRPTGFLFIFLIVTAVVMVIRIARTDRRTGAGIDAFKDACSRNERLRIAPRGPESGMAVALYGTSVLAIGPLGDLHRLRSGSGNDGGGCTSSGCGGGGCGGGCGGCGS